MQESIVLYQNNIIPVLFFIIAGAILIFLMTATVIHCRLNDIEAHEFTVSFGTLKYILTLKFNKSKDPVVRNFGRIAFFSFILGSLSLIAINLSGTFA